MEIPLFPLPNLVLFPNVVLPLHIFEERYKLLINASIDTDEPFGLIGIREGASEETEDSIHRVGVTARVMRVERIDEGRMNILCHGESRFRIRRFTQQVPYWKASIQLFDDAPESAESLQPLYDDLAELYRKAVRLGGKLDADEESPAVLPESAIELSFMLSYVLDLESEEKQKLLELTSTSERLRSLSAVVMSAIQKVEQQIARKKILHKVQGNGDLGKPGTGKRGQ